MKIRKTFIVVFALTFLIGCALVLSSSVNSVPTETNPAATPELPVQVQNEIKPDAIYYETAKNFGGAEILDDDYWEKEIKYKYELLETGEFHGDEVTAKTGERWLGLFGKNKDFYLALTSVDVRRVHDQIVDGKNKKRKTGKKVSIQSKSEPLFLIKNASKLNEGKVETIFKGVANREADETEGYSTELKSEFIYDYQMDGVNYVLRVEKVFNESLETVHALILESGGKKQILHVSSDDYLGTLYWVGDLDRDRKPDFFLAPWIKENISESSLFLSSEADKSHFVKKVASLGTTGC